MGSKEHGTAIEWTHLPGYRGETWNPHGGCTKVSAGCENCWALRQVPRLESPVLNLYHYQGVAEHGNWTGRLHSATSWRTFFKPLTWRKPRAVFPCSMSDFFHPGADPWRDSLWNIIYDTPQHLYLILTKRPERIPERLPSFGKKEWPWKNVWLGATVENQEMADKRAWTLRNVPAAKRFLSLEPLLGPVNLLEARCDNPDGYGCTRMEFIRGIDWVIVGGESGPGARPMDVEWAESILRQCREAGIPFFMKQMTKKAPIPKHLMVREFPKDHNFSSTL